MSSSQVKRYYRHSSGQKRAFDKQNMYQLSANSHLINKTTNKHKQQHLIKRTKRKPRKQKNNQKHLAVAINEHSIYRDHRNLGNAFARAYQKAVEKREKSNEINTNKR